MNPRIKKNCICDSSNQIKANTYTHAYQLRIHLKVKTVHTPKKNGFALKIDSHRKGKHPTE